MRPLIVIRRVPKIDFMRWHLFGFAFSVALTALTIGLFSTVGLNYGIDFTGGTLIEVRVASGPADLAAVRDLPARIQPDDIGGDPDDRRIFDQRHGGDLRPRARVDAQIPYDAVSRA